MSTPAKQKIVLSPREVKDYGGPGHTKVYELINSGELRARKMGSRTFILMSDLTAWLESLPAIRSRAE